MQDVTVARLQSTRVQTPSFKCNVYCVRVSLWTCKNIPCTTLKRRGRGNLCISPRTTFTDQHSDVPNEHKRWKIEAQKNKKAYAIAFYFWNVTIFFWKIHQPNYPLLALPDIFGLIYLTPIGWTSWQAVFQIRDILVRSGSADPYLWLTDPDPAPDPALF